MTDAGDIRFGKIPYGFIYGPTTVQRVASDPKKGWVVLEIKTPRGMIQVHATKTGMMKVYRTGKVEFEEIPDD